ncbi:MAG: ion channel [Myxococcota bacterium]|nr:ion channel [Myxococcota bacterium]
MNTPQICSADQCPIHAEPGSSLCIIHIQKDNKSREEVSRGLDAYDAAGQKKIFNGYFESADFSGLYINRKNFFDCNLRRANFSKARLFKVGFDFSNLDEADFEEIILERVDLRRVQSASGLRLFHALYDGALLPDSKVLGDYCIYELEVPRNPHKALETYHGLTKVYREYGFSMIASHYYEREMNIRRELATGLSKVWLFLLWAICGYGERPMRTFITFLAVIFGFAGLYVADGGPNPDNNNLPAALYFSVVTFTSLGYGDISPVGFSRFLAAGESLIGFFMISLFVVVFCRRMMN